MKRLSSEASTSILAGATIGLGVGDRFMHFRALDERAEIVAEGQDPHDPRDADRIPHAMEFLSTPNVSSNCRVPLRSTTRCLDRSPEPNRSK